MKKSLGLVLVLAAVTLAGCGGASRWDGMNGAAPEGSYFSPSYDGVTGWGENFRYDSIVETGYSVTDEEDSVYFSLDRNTAGYSQVRAQINGNREIAPDSVRIEELINYFSYDYPAPAEGEVMKSSVYLTDCPWQQEHKLVTVGVKTEERKVESERNNYVFLIDVSGSMNLLVEGMESMTCLDLVKYGIGTLVEGLGEDDYVSIATYAGEAGQALQPTKATDTGKEQIMRTVDRLSAYGSTNGSGGLEVAYDLAARNFSENGNNRVILLSDGDFNVGAQTENALMSLIRNKAKTGIYLSVLGVGIGNMRDDFMQTLALNGNGNYAYIDTPAEAKKVFSEELSGMLVTVAKDAKAGVTFSKETVEKYRLICYDMKIMSEEDFNSQKKDAGEIGSNLCVTALFEVELKDGAEEGASLGNVEIRFKDVAKGEEARTATAEIVNTPAESEDAVFISCVAEFGLLLRKSQYKGDASYEGILKRLAELPV